MIVPPENWDRCLGDLDILLRLLGKVSGAMLVRNERELFAALHELMNYADRFKSSLWRENQH